MKILLRGLIIFLFASIFIIAPAKAQPAAPPCILNPNGAGCSVVLNQICNDPSLDYYTTQTCVEFRLGLGSIQSDTIIIPRDPNSLIVVAFRIFLYAAVVITVGRVVLIGIQFGGVKGDDADKKKELFKQLFFTLGGMALALSGLGCTFFVQQTFFGTTFDDQIIKCSDLPANASQELKDKCKANLPTPTLKPLPTGTFDQPTPSCDPGLPGCNGPF